MSYKIRVQTSVGKQLRAKAGRKKQAMSVGKGLTDLDMWVGLKQRIKSCTSPCFLTVLQGKGPVRQRSLLPTSHFWILFVASKSIEPSVANERTSVAIQTCTAALQIRNRFAMVDGKNPKSN